MRIYKRWYTKKSFKLMRNIRLIILIITSLLWLPLLAITYLGVWMEVTLDFLDDLLDKFLDEIIPQIK